MLSKHFAADGGEQPGDAPDDAFSHYSGQLHAVAFLKKCMTLRNLHHFPAGASDGAARECSGLARQPTSATARDGYTDQFQQAQTMAAFPPPVHDLLDLDGLLSAKERQTREAVRDFMVGGICCAQTRQYICCGRVWQMPCWM